MPIKSTTTTGIGGDKKKKVKKNLKECTEQVKNIRLINVFLESLLSVFSHTGSHRPPDLPRMPSNTVLISRPAVGAAQILMLSYSVFMAPMSTGIRTSVFSFVGALSGLLYIP